MRSRAPLQTAVVLVAGAFFAASAVTGLAQDATPAGGMAGMTGAPDSHPAHIHVGPCDQLDPNPTYMLADVAPIATAPAAGVAPVERSESTVDVSLADLLAGGYAVNVHKSAAEIGTYIACGNLGSVADPGDGTTLTVGLRELNHSGYTGFAILTGKGETTDVTVYLAEGLAATGEAAAASPAASAAGGTVVIKNLAFAPSPIEIAAGGRVTWANDDLVPHTATARDRAQLQSGTIAPGASFTQEFDHPGTYDYFCEFHAGMKGTVVVK